MGLDVKRPSIDRIRELLSYDPETGYLRWRTTHHYRCVAGQMAGSLMTIGYLTIAIDGCKIYAHHIAWAIVTGKWPKQIDHKDGNRRNNKWSNLRKATNHQNQANKKKYLGFLPKGVRKSRKVYCAQISVNGQYMYLGTFKTPESAHQAYVEAAQKYFCDFARAS